MSRALLLTTDYSSSNALFIAIAGTNVIVSWPTNGNQYMLFSTATLVTNTNSFYGIYDNFRWVSNVTAIGERYVHVGAMTNNARFYRLQQRRTLGLLFLTYNLLVARRRGRCRDWRLRRRRTANQSQDRDK